MRKIAIIGSGQTGLLFAHALLRTGYNVSVYSDRTAEQWLNESRPTGTAARFGPSLQFERELGLNFWEKEAAFFEGIHLTFCPTPLNPVLYLNGRFEQIGMAIDLRLQSHRWMNEFVARGGNLVVEKITLERLDEIAAENDLTVVASGRAELSQMFPTDAQRSVYDKPQRNLALVIMKGNDATEYAGVPFRPILFNFIGTTGEAFFMPYYHKSLTGTWGFVFEPKPGGEMDRFTGAKSGAEAVEIAKQVIKDLFPWNWDWVKDMELADEHSWLVGSITPTVKLPVGKLPSGRVVTGLGDTLMSLDPIAGQGANNGNRMARHLTQAIIAHGDQPFDANWMQATFDQFYRESGEATYTFNNIFLEPLAPAGQEILMAQSGSTGSAGNTDGKQAIADAFCANFEDPRSLTSTLQDVTKARAFIDEKLWKSQEAV